MTKGFIEATWPAPSFIRAYTSLRSSNIIPMKEENEALIFHKDLLQNHIPLPHALYQIQQTHSNIAVKADPSVHEKEADAIYTDAANTVCSVLTADCLPVLVCDRLGSKVAAIHAGWRGLAKGIIENTLEQLAIPAAETLIWLGPAIGPQKFEVRGDVYQAFTKQDPEASSAFQAINQEQWLADIYQLARLRLQKRGINAIFGGEYCTFSDKDKFFSYRREGKNTGRMLSLIWIENQKNHPK